MWRKCWLPWLAIRSAAHPNVETQMQEEHMTTLIERLKNPEDYYESTDPKKANAVLMSLCQEAADALAAPVQEPVCHICGGTGEMDSGGTLPWGEAINIPCECTAPPAAQRQWVGLTDEEFRHANKSTMNLPIEEVLPTFARAIEAKLKEKNNG
jgi:hypothetical protein